MERNFRNGIFWRVGYFDFLNISGEQGPGSRSRAQAFSFPLLISITKLTTKLAVLTGMKARSSISLMYLMLLLALDSNQHLKIMTIILLRGKTGPDSPRLTIQLSSEFQKRGDLFTQFRNLRCYRTFHFNKRNSSHLMELACFFYI